MPKLIFRCNYIKSNSVRHRGNYVKYIATRENVEKVITVDNLKEKKANFIDYLGNRPQVEKIGTHGLFTNVGEVVNLNEVANEVAEHKGILWTNVISIKREDAQRLGYDKGKEWQNLIRSEIPLLAEAFKIKPENLKWYCAFHNESHHPHVHLVVYSKDESEGFIGRAGIEKLRREFAHKIFRQDFANIYEDQTEARDKLRKEGLNRVTEIVNRIKDGTLENKKIESDLLLLYQRLSNTKGKKVYGYLKADVKKIVDSIVDELEKDSRITELYDEWYKYKSQIDETYKDIVLSKKPLSKQEEFKTIKNAVIKEALKLDISEIECSGGEDNENNYEIADVVTEPKVEIESQMETAYIGGYGRKKKKNTGATTWSDEILEAKRLLQENPSDSVGFELMIKEANKGNGFAMYELGRIYNIGKAVEKDDEKSHEWYEKALKTFLKINKDDMYNSIIYRIGKMYVNGLGTEKDYAEGRKWLEYIQEENQYAKYLIGVMYQRGLGVEVDMEQAIYLYKDVAEGIPYASYEVARYLEKTEPDNKNGIQYYYKCAYEGFSEILKDMQPDDKQKSTIQYKVGRMAYYGLGTEVNIDEALMYLTEAGDKGHQYAQFLLGVMYLKVKEIRDIEVSLKWLNMSAEQGNEFAKDLIEKIKNYQELFIRNTFVNSATNLFRQVVSAFEDNINSLYSSEQSRMRLSKKRRRELAKKNKNVKEYEESLNGVDADVVFRRRC